MLASRRAKKRVSALDCMCLRSDVATWQQRIDYHKKVCVANVDGQHLTVNMKRV